MSRFSIFDAAAVSLSGLCLAHCLALPLSAALLPSLAAWTHVEWVHWVFVALAVPATTAALLRARRVGTLSWGVLTTAACGLAMLVTGASKAFAEAFEVPITVAGSLMLAGAHIANWRAHQRGAPNDAPLR